MTKLVQEKKPIPEKFQEKKEMFSIVRIMQHDIPGNKNLLTGFTYIKGVSWSISNALCKLLKLDPNKKISELSKKEIEEVVNFLENASTKLPVFLTNRRKDFETGKNYHLVGSRLDMKEEFDIRRLKKIRSYRGVRHALGQPTRGQRTRSHFRSKGKKKSVVGVKKAKAREEKEKKQ